MAITHRALLDALEQVVPDQVSGGGFDPESGPQLGGLDIGAVSGLLHPGPRRIVRTAPAVFVVEGVLKRAECLLPAGRGDVQAAVGLQVASGGKDMNVRAAVPLAVQHRRPCVAVGFEPRPSRLLELVEYGFDLLFGRLVLRRPRDHAGGVLVVEGKRIGHGGHLVRVSPEHLDAFALPPGRVKLAEKVPGRLAGRPGPMREKLNVHLESDGIRGCPDRFITICNSNQLDELCSISGRQRRSLQSHSIPVTIRGWIT